MLLPEGLRACRRPATAIATLKERYGHTPADVDDRTPSEASAASRHPEEP